MTTKKKTTKSLPLLRGSERSTFKTCQQQWWWAWRMGYRDPQPRPNALWFGGGIHLALAHYYQPQGKSALRGFKRGPDPLETWAKFCKGERPRFFRRDTPGTVDESDFVNLIDLGQAMLGGYVDYYDGDPSWEFLAPEMPFSVYIPDYSGSPIVNFVGTWDGAYRDHNLEGEVRLLETKTTARVSTAHLNLDPQGLGYDLVADAELRSRGIIGQKESVRYIMYNFLRKAIPKQDDRPVNADGLRLNKDGSVSKRQKLQAEMYVRHPVERTNAEKRSTLAHIQNEFLQMQAIKDGTFEPTKNQGFLGENCKRCDFYEMCELHEQGADWQEFADNFLVQRDPYADHREGAKSSKFI